MSNLTYYPIEQRMQALELANSTRYRRSQLKRDLADGTASFVELLAEPPDWLLTAKVYDMVLALPKVGPIKASSIFTRQNISASRTFGGITVDQRRRLLAGMRVYPSIAESMPPDRRDATTHRTEKADD
jgi:hypothetical protein